MDVNLDPHVRCSDVKLLKALLTPKAWKVWKAIHLGAFCRCMTKPPCYYYNPLVYIGSCNRVISWRRNCRASGPSQVVSDEYFCRHTRGFFFLGHRQSGSGSQLLLCHIWSSCLHLHCTEQKGEECGLVKKLIWSQHTPFRLLHKLGNEVGSYSITFSFC